MGNEPKEDPFNDNQKEKIHLQKKCNTFLFFK